MVQVYDAGNIDYNRNGDITLTPLSAIVHPILNGVWEATLKHPIDCEGRWKHIVEESVVKMPSFNGDQLFRIKRKTKSDKYVTAAMEPVFMDAMDDCFLVDARPTNKTGQQALDIMTAPNSKYRGRSDITQTATAYYQFKNLIEAINGENENSFVNRWGGEILFDNYNISINQRIGGDYGVELRYGKNIPADGLSEEVDIRNVVTRIYPKAFNGHTMTDSGYVDSPLIDNYPTVKGAVISFEDVKMRADAQEEDEEKGITICDTQEQLDKALRDKCQGQYEQGLDKPKVTISAKMVLLQNTELYKDFKVLEEVSLGDTIHCINTPLGIITDARVIELEYDSVQKMIVSVELGDFQYNYFDRVSSTIDRIDTAIRPDGSVVAEQISGIIDGIKSQMRAQSSVAKKSSVRAMLFEDLDPNSPTYGAMCMGTMGFQIAGARTADGRDWNWSTFGTGKGFFADLIVAGDMLADRIRGGTLEIGGATGRDGVIRVLDAPGNEIGHWDKSGLSVKQGDISGTSITLGGANNQNGKLRLLGSNQQELVTLTNEGVYSKGKYVCGSDAYGRQVEVSEGAFKILSADGREVGKLFAVSNNWIRLDCGNVGIRFLEDAIYLDAPKVGPGGFDGKSGRAEFSDGSYLEFKQGFLIGGRTQGGGSI